MLNTDLKVFDADGLEIGDAMSDAELPQLPPGRVPYCDLVILAFRHRTMFYINTRST